MQSDESRHNENSTATAFRIQILSAVLVAFDKHKASIGAINFTNYKTVPLIETDDRLP